MLKKNKNKWSFKYDKCKICGTTEKRHQAKGTCINCYERVRGSIKRKDPEVLKQMREKKREWHLKAIQKEEYKAKLRLISNQNYHKNKLLFSIKRQVKKRKEKGLPCLTMYIDNNKIEFPFESLEKPLAFKTKELEIWKKNNELFEKVINFINNKNKNE